MRRCPLFECNAEIPDTYFACVRHWHTLTVPQKNTIHAAYDDYLAGNIGVERLREVQQEVIDAVQKRRKI